jgi:ankyrin repeat protein
MMSNRRKYFLLTMATLVILMLQVNNGLATETEPEDVVVSCGYYSPYTPKYSVFALRLRALALIFALRRNGTFFVADDLIWVCIGFLRQAGFDDQGRIVFLPMDFKSDKGKSDLSAVLGHQVRFDRLSLTSSGGNKSSHIIDKNILLASNKFGIGSIWRAIYCIAAGAILEPTSEYKYSVLHKYCDDPAMIKFFLDSNSDVNSEMDDVGTTLHLVADSGQIETTQFLIKYQADIGVKNKYKNTALQVAAAKGHLPIVRLLVEASANMEESSIGGWTPLHAAAQEGHLSVVLLLLESKADLKTVSNWGDTALHQAARSGHLPVIQLLFESGLCVDVAARAGYTPLHLAAQDGHLSAVQLLLELKADLKADLKAMDSYGDTSADLALRNGHIMIANFLGISIENEKTVTSCNCLVM